MLEEAILQQKQALEQWQSFDFVPREKLTQVKQALDSPLIKVITGPRRAGKSVFAFELLKDLPFAYLNFDDERLTKISDYEKILSVLKSTYPHAKYFFFDEIQNLPDWELFANRLARTNHNLIITGSNATLLSQELATALTGRHLAYEILPFSFREYLLAKKIEAKTSTVNLLSHLNAYLKTGGFPETVVSNINPLEYLKTLSESILLKDVIKRHRVKYTPEIYRLKDFIFSNFSNEHSFRSLQKALEMPSSTTTQKYFRYFEESYLAFSLARFHSSYKHQIRTSRKIYLVDTGFAGTAFTTSENLGRLMENAVFLELLRQGYKPNLDLFYYKQDNKEIDFLIQQGGKIIKLIQVCQTLAGPKTKKREIKPFAAFKDDSVEKLIITWDEEGQNCLPLYRFLLSP